MNEENVTSLHEVMMGLFNGEINSQMITLPVPKALPRKCQCYRGEEVTNTDLTFGNEVSRSRRNTSDMYQNPLSLIPEMVYEAEGYISAYAPESYPSVEECGAGEQLPSNTQKALPSPKKLRISKKRREVEHSIDAALTQNVMVYKVSIKYDGSSRAYPQHESILIPMYHGKVPVLADFHNSLMETLNLDKRAIFDLYVVTEDNNPSPLLNISQLDKKRRNEIYLMPKGKVPVVHKRKVKNGAKRIPLDTSFLLELEAECKSPTLHRSPPS